MRASPDIDCLFLNAGMQRRYDFSQPEKVDLAEFNSELTVNYTSFVALTHAFLPYLLKKPSPSSIIFTGSNLAIVPAAPLLGYSATKAALNSFTLCLREQLKNTNVRVLELSPPPVQSKIYFSCRSCSYCTHSFEHNTNAPLPAELHDVPQGETAGRALGMPVGEFTEQAYTRLASGEEQVIIGAIGDKARFDTIVEKRVETFRWLADVMAS